MKIADYLRLDKPLQFEYARQLGVPYAVGRLPDGEIETYAESFEKLKELKETYKNKGVDLKVIEPAPPNQKIKLGLDFFEIPGIMKNVRCGGLAQLVRALASHARGHWFESSSLHQNE